MNRTTRKRSQWQQPRSQAPRRRFSFPRDESGGVAVITAICLVFLIGFVALVVDMGHLHAVRNEVQNAADAAALAGARALFPLNGYPDTGLIPLTEPPFVTVAVQTARDTVGQNQAGSIVNLTTAAADVQTGIWNWNSRTFTADATPSYNINAVRVMARRDSVANQPVSTWFASILGIDSVPVNAEAVAAVGYIEQPTGAYLPIFVPHYIYQNMLSPDKYNAIQASPDPGDTFAWAAPAPESANAQYLKDAVNGVDGIPMPSTATGNLVNLSNGQLGSVEHEIMKQITAGKTAYPEGAVDNSGVPILDSAGNRVYGWFTYMLVGNVPNQDTSQPLDVKMNQQATVTDFVPVVVTDIVHTKKTADSNPQWQINFFLLPDSNKFVIPGGQPGGPVSNIYATSPKLVQ
jgi:Flp pilus assembly protein TadG